MKTLKYNISFPSKTFLIGEYAVLEGAPAVLVNTCPRFCFSVTEKAKPVEDNITGWFHPQSPAGEWLKQHPQITSYYHMESQDPYFGKGGFGFSSAQFNLVYLLACLLKSKEKECVFKNSIPELFQLWSAYRGLNFKGYKPSGADVVSQCLGDLCLFSFDPFSAHSVRWPFPDLDFFLIRTNTVLNTYEHLNFLSRNFLPRNFLHRKLLPSNFLSRNFLPRKCLSSKYFSGLSELAKKAKDCINQQDKEGFIFVIEQYSFALKERGLTDEKTLLFLDRVKSLKEVITAKGCGAMGAEVVAVFFDPKNTEAVKAFLKNENIVACSKDLTDGVKICKKEITKSP